MRSRCLVDPISRRTAVLCRRSQGGGRRAALGAALVCALGAGCVTTPPPVPPPVVSAPPPPVPPPPIVQAPPPVVDSGPPPIIIHRADLHGRFESRQGRSITIRALLVMNKTHPEVGNKGVLFCAPPGATGDEEWVPMGDVEVQKPLDGEGRMQVKITGDDKQFVIPGGKKPTPLVRNTRVRLNWEW